MTSSTLSPSTRLMIAPRVSLQALGEGEGGVLLRMDTGEMYTVNDTALSFLRSLDGKITIAQAANRMLDAFDVEAGALEADLLEIASHLAGEKLVALAE